MANKKKVDKKKVASKYDTKVVVTGTTADALLVLTKAAKAKNKQKVDKPATTTYVKLDSTDAMKAINVRMCFIEDNIANTCDDYNERIKLYHQESAKLHRMYGLTCTEDDHCGDYCPYLLSLEQQKAYGCVMAIDYTERARDKSEQIQRINAYITDHGYDKTVDKMLESLGDF